MNRITYINGHLNLNLNNLDSPLYLKKTYKSKNEISIFSTLSYLRFIIACVSLHDMHDRCENTILNLVLEKRLVSCLDYFMLQTLVFFFWFLDSVV